ncbi:hypothetical protein [Paenibacillus timonensis]|uniref:hypothetical protein n=1 Tax=Paenibacillus timonensis TaxID=225915 RepID=UPI003F983C34
MHACLKYVTRDFMTNATLCQRFGMDSRQSSIASSKIKDAVNVTNVKAKDPDTAPKYMKYVLLLGLGSLLDGNLHMAPLLGRK